MAGPALRILGIDPGLRITGFGIIEKNGSKLVYIASGCIKSGDADLPERLKIILENLREVIAQHQPQQIALEKVFVNVNPASTLALGQARGTAICAAVDAGLRARPPPTPRTRSPAPFATRTAGRGWGRFPRADFG